MTPGRALSIDNNGEQRATSALTTTEGLDWGMLQWLGPEFLKDFKPFHLCTPQLTPFIYPQGVRGSAPRRQVEFVGKYFPKKDLRGRGGIFPPLTQKAREIS